MDGSPYMLAFPNSNDCCCGRVMSGTSDVTDHTWGMQTICKPYANHFSLAECLAIVTNGENYRRSPDLDIFNQEGASDSSLKNDKLTAIEDPECTR